MVRILYPGTAQERELWLQPRVGHDYYPHAPQITLTAEAATVNRWLLSHALDHLPGAAGDGYVQLGMDVKWPFGLRFGEDGFYPRSATLLVLADGNSSLLVQLLDLDEFPWSLRVLLQSESVVLCGIDLASKYERLLAGDRWFGEDLGLNDAGASILDLDKLASWHGFSDGRTIMGPLELREQVLGETVVDYRHDLEESDWGRFDLSEEQVDHAVSEVWNLWRVADVLQSDVPAPEPELPVSPAGLWSTGPGYPQLQQETVAHPLTAFSGYVVELPPPVTSNRSFTIRSPAGSPLHVTVTDQPHIAVRWLTKHLCEAPVVRLGHPAIPASVREAAADRYGGGGDDGQGCSLMGLDTQWTPQFTRGGRWNPVAVMALCTGRNCLLVQLPRLHHVPWELVDVLASNRSLLVGAGVQLDARLLRQHYASFGERGGGGGGGGGGSALLLELKELTQYTGRQRDLSGILYWTRGLELGTVREVKEGDWEAWPLSMAQIECAARDAWASYEVARFWLGV